MGNFDGKFYSHLFMPSTDISTEETFLNGDFSSNSEVESVLLAG